MRDAEEYTISIRLESIEGERLYVARVEELPDIEEYADTYDFARELVLDTIKTTQDIFGRKGLVMPAPKVFTQPDVSGRVTLRLPKSVHAKCISESEREGVSLNSYIMTCIASYNTQDIDSMSSTIISNINAHLAEFHTRTMQSLSFGRKTPNYSVMKRSEINIDLLRASDDDPFADSPTETTRGFPSAVFFSSKVLPC